ncbi:MAG: hypothetical protein EHM21_09550, partial [Chloroflexi bacterium]
MSLLHSRQWLRVLILFGSLAILAGLFRPANRVESAFASVYPLVAIRDETLETELLFFNPGSDPANLTLTVGGTNLILTIPAKATARVTGADFPLLDPGRYAGYASSDSLVEGLATIYQKSGSLAGIYRGMAPGDGQAGTEFSQYFGPVTPSSTLALVGMEDQGADIQVEVYDSSGASVLTLDTSIIPCQVKTVSFSDLSSELNPPYLVKVTSASTAPAPGLLDNLGVTNENFFYETPRIYPPLQLAGGSGVDYRFFLARDAHLLPEDSGNYMTHLFTANIGSAPATVTRTLFGADGSVKSNRILTLPELAADREDAETYVPMGQSRALADSASQPLAYNEITTMQTPVPGRSIASYPSSASPYEFYYRVNLPGLAVDDRLRSL